MTNDDFIVAIELGSSKVTAIAGQKQPDGAIKVLAYAQDPSESFIRKGCINNFNKMTSCVDSIKQKLENALGRSVASCYVGIGGMGMHTVANTVTRHLGEKQLITAEMVNNVKDSNNSMPGNDREILEVIPQDYQLGTQVVADPIGIASDVIEGHFLNIISNTSVSESVYNCFRSAHLNVVGMPITVLALADAILTEPEKRSGCAFVDMGAETTSVAIFKNNILRHFAVIPLGGANVNRDLCTLQIEDSEAEQLKRKYATAYSNEEEDKHEPVTLGDGRTVKYEEFNGLVEARMEEIILNIKHQIALSKYDDSKLVSGIVVTGGAANMKNIDKAFAAFTDFRKVNGDELIEEISSAYSRDGIEETMIISRSNKRATLYNNGIRNRILYREEELSSGDRLMIAKNNFFWTAGNKEMDFIANGEIIQVLRVRRTYELYGFRFADVSVSFQEYDLETDVKILLDTLQTAAPALPKDLNDKLFYTILEDYDDVPTKAGKMKKKKAEPHYNVLQVKYAYAVTCHKALVGQWRCVFVDRMLFGEETISRDLLRWLYTALTRATEKLYFVNFDERFFEDK